MTDDTLTTALAPLITRSWNSFGMPVLELQVAKLMPWCSACAPSSATPCSWT
jgi:hypothetical protein